MNIPIHGSPFRAQKIPWATSIVCESTIHDFIVGIQNLAVMNDGNELEADVRENDSNFRFSNLNTKVGKLFHIKSISHAR